MDAGRPANPHNGFVYRYLRARLVPPWRIGPRSLWPDIALAAVLSLIGLWLTVQATRSGDTIVPHRILSTDPYGIQPLKPFVPFGPDRVTESISATERVRAIVLSLLMTVPLAWRRRWPLAGLVVQFAGLLAFHHGVNTATLLAVVIGAYSLARYERSVLVSMGTLLIAATVTALTFNNTTPSLPGWAGAFVILLPIGLFGTTIRVALNRLRASDQRAEALERGQQAATRLAVAQERARIARELHDVVSHHVSVMTIQAGAAGKVIDAEPELARGALSAIEASGREAMTELRHLLGVLTPGPADDDLLHPQPGLDQLDTLVDNVRGAGQPVSVQRTPTALPRGVDLAAYRVIQEALTNALRYAPGARTDVVIALTTSEVGDGEELVVEVTNDEAPAGSARVGAPGGAGTGSGLLGLAERLHLYQGTLETGRRLGGGVWLRARMPLESRLPLESGMPVQSGMPVEAP
jgi:signal transduction histidine kinase